MVLGGPSSIFEPKINNRYNDGPWVSSLMLIRIDSILVLSHIHNVQLLFTKADAVCTHRFMLLYSMHHNPPWQRPTIQGNVLIMRVVLARPHISICGREMS